MIKNPYSKRNIARVEKIDLWAALKTFQGSDVAELNWQTFRTTMSSQYSRPGHGFGSSDASHCAVDTLKSLAIYGHDVFKLATMSPPDFLKLLKDWFGI